MKLFFVLGGLFLGVVAAVGQSRDSLFLMLAVPESDTVVTASATYRLSACTNPGNKTTINERDFKVYGSGAFAGLLDLQVGENLFTMKATNSAGQSISHPFVIMRSTPLTSTSSDTLVIEDAMMIPSSDQWLGAGDVLRVQFKGTPGGRASYMGGMPMRELPTSESNGIGGVYRGIHVVDRADTLHDQPVEFVLQDARGATITRKTTAKVSFKAGEFPLVGITKGPRPYLNFGLGEDRLGGAKYSFLVPGVRLAITGKLEGQYRVALSDAQEAWIPDDLVDLQPAGSFPPFSLSGTMTLSGDERYDYVMLALDEKLPYTSTQELQPTRIHLDVYGAVPNTNWITQQSTSQEVKNLYYQQVGKNHLRVTIELKHNQAWGYGISYQGTTLVVRIRRQPESLRLKKLMIALDPGHGGENNGAAGSTGVKEKNITLPIVKELQHLLERKGAKVFLTRSDDTFSTTADRLKRVIDSGADILVSIHANSIGLTTNPLLTQGVSTYYKYICYRPLSVCILNRVLETGLVSFGNVGSFNFTLNSPTELPNVLVETAFLSHPEDEMKLLDEDFREEMAKKIVDGLEDFLDSCEE